MEIAEKDASEFEIVCRMLRVCWGLGIYCLFQPRSRALVLSLSFFYYVCTDFLQTDLSRTRLGRP